MHRAMVVYTMIWTIWFNLELLPFHKNYPVKLQKIWHIIVYYKVCLHFPNAILVRFTHVMCAQNPHFRCKASKLCSALLS